MNLKRKLESCQITPAKRVKSTGYVSKFFPEEMTPTSSRSKALALFSIMIAAREGDLESVMYHVYHSTKNYAQERFGPFDMTLLHLAASSENTKLMEFLLEYLEVDPFIKDSKQKLPVDYATSGCKTLLLRKMNWESRKGILYTYTSKKQPSLPMCLVRYIAEDFL